MTDDHPAAARTAFIDQLNDLRERTGNPTLKELRQLSLRTDSRDNQYRELATSTTHDILTHKRKRLPDWRWVALFIETCHLAAEVKGLRHEPLGGLQDWNARWIEARTSRRTPASPNPASPTLAPPNLVPPSPASPNSASPIPAPSTSAPSMPSSMLPPHTALPTVALPVATPRVRDLRPAWSQDQDRLVETYGRTGVRLLERLDTSDTHACLLLAVIAMLRGYPEESRNWLRKLANAGDMAALRLFNDPAPETAAAELAYRYGREHLEAHPGRDSLAMFLYRLAAEHDHVDAAFQLAVYHQRREEYGPAAVWFEHAAKRGHPDAVVRSGDLAAQVMAEQAIAPS